MLSGETNVRHRIASLVLAGAAASAAAALAASPADDAYQAAENLLASGAHLEAAEGYADFAKRFATDPRAPEAHLRGAEALFRAGRIEESLGEFERQAHDPRAKFRAGNALFLLGRFAPAARRLRELLDMSELPHELEGPARYFLVRSLLAAGRAEDARRVIAGFRPHDDRTAVFASLAKGDIEAAGLAPGGDGPDPRRVDAALSAYREALKRRPASRLVPEITFRIAEIERRRGRAKEALESYTRAAQADPDGPVAPYAALGAS